MINSCWSIRLALAVIATLHACWGALSSTTHIFQTGKQWNLSPYLSQGCKLSFWSSELGCMSPLLPFLICVPIQLVCGLDFCFCLFRENIVIFCLTLGLLWSLWDNTDFHIQLFSEVTVGPAIRTVWNHGDLCKIWVNDRNGNYNSHWVTVISSNVRSV